MSKILTESLLKELEAEAPATRKCLERIPGDKFDWKPQEKALTMARLALIFAEIPRWIPTAIEESEINFGTFAHVEAKTAADFVKEFDSGMEKAKAVLEKCSDEDLQEMFTLKAGDRVLMSTTKEEMVRSSINHLVHHRGQMTVYFRIAGISVPSIYGPSGDEKTF